MTIFDDIAGWFKPSLGSPSDIASRGSTIANIFSPISSNQLLNYIKPGSTTVRPPSVPQTPMYDEGSKYREARDQAIGLGQGPSIADIMQQLQNLQDPSRYMMNSDQLLSQARNQASAQYDPVIAQLRQAMGAAQTRGKQNEAQLGQMFGQLSDSLNADIAPLEAKNAQTRQATQDQFGQLKQQIADTYNQSQADQEAMMKRLNIEAAIPAATEKQAQDKAFFTNRASTDENTALTAQDQESRGNVEYTRRGSEVARTEGTQRQADLMNQLSQLMDAYQGQIGANEAAKAQAANSIFTQLSSQANDSAVKRAQQDFENYISTVNLGRALKNDQLSQNKTTSAVKSIADVPGRAISLGLPTASAQNIQNVFSSAVGSDPRILGGIDPQSGTPLSKEQAAQYIVEAGRNAGLSQAELNALQAMALEYFGRA